LWYCCTEDHGLSFGHVVLQGLDVLVEAHIKHFVSLVEDLVVAVANIESEVLAQVNQSAWRCHEHLGLLLLNLKHYIFSKLSKSYFVHLSVHRRRKRVPT
jgi:hypothetical protein